MRFVVREGVDPVAVADRVLLAAIGIPGGGVVAVGRTVVPVRPGEVAGTSDLRLGPLARENAGVVPGTTVDVTRAVLPPAERVLVAGTLPAEPRSLLHALQGRPVAAGDRIAAGDGTLTVAAVEPAGRGLVGVATRFEETGPPAARPRPPAATVPPVPSLGEGTAPRAAPTVSEALLVGLDVELEILTGWITLLTSAADLPTAWGLPRVAGILLEGPNGCGKSELVAAAAAAAGVTVTEVVVDLVYKPARLLDLLAGATKADGPRVVFVDRLEALAGREGLTPVRSEVAAILRWFLETVAARPNLACILGVADRAGLDPAIARSPLLPRALAVPPPDLRRRALLFEASLARVPAERVDFVRLATKSAGFSAADISAAVVHAASRTARTGEPVSEEGLLEAVAATEPSLGSVPLGELPSYGFEAVADLAETKQRLVEAVVWPVTDPGRFAALGIDPPRGVLLSGPPGTGKTFVVRALAHEAGAAFFPVKGAELLDKYVGESERAVREVFARARAAAPSLVFFDELDALAPVRGRSLTAVTDSVVAALLTELDGIVDRGDVAVVGATNRPDLVDPALLRPGRFEVHLELGLPDAAARRELLAGSDVPFAEDVDLDGLATATDGASFADLVGILREAALTGLRRDLATRTVTAADVDAALARWARRRPGG